MSLGIAWKGHKCAALAADSRRTDYKRVNGQLVRQGHTDDAVNLLAAPAPNQFVGVLTSNSATIGGADVKDLFDVFARQSLGAARLSVAEYAQALFGFFRTACADYASTTDAMLLPQFLVVGFDPGSIAVTIYDVKVADRNGPSVIPAERDYQAIGEDELVLALVGNREKHPLSVVAGKLGIPVAAVEAARAKAQSILGLLVGKPIGAGNCAAIVDCLLSHALRLEELAVKYPPKCGGPIDLAVIRHGAGIEWFRRKG